jgi:predicted secreted protein
MNNRGDRLARLAQLQTLTAELRAESAERLAREREQRWREQCHARRLAVAQSIITKGNSHER